ncbi:hypothetical protein GCM10011490_14940 [Pseudoclavibacter endophyticus]|uniref:Uncharacterized protein n=1 Tax=Pseudoclavibacter endophyticus TaxID=1778590 RepID=A0A6H9WQ58_9MICO|nr:hypothetical protein [Pseudoclavibacter endophyticus]KAB1649117.1 hypothetical protein F8O04_02210 [Pseudoclavibacter endophyticus]GGA65286.1 hypothetical protein GCM10011490_14940 [Pseudoclavibacter endophyticus]
MIRRFLALLAAGVTAAAGLAAFQATAPDPDVAGIEQAAAQAQARDWNPGNIISDELFYDGSAMSAAEAQDFLVSRNSSSSPTALRNYAQNTPSMPADKYCAAYQGSANDSAASIIAKVGAACKFSQKAMLVLLEKEQSLVSLAAPTTGRLAAATGFGCPDTAPCDSSVGGFFYQIYYAARQFQVYKANPYSFNHIPGATNNVLYNPNFSCGSSPVYIENSATAGLYNYTPYQPNQAALNNLRGTGDGCSAYGNRNFWWMYTDWFGSTQGSNAKDEPSLIMANGGTSTYLLSDGIRHYIPPEYLDRYTAAFGDVTVLPQQHLDWTPWGSWADQFLSDADSNAYYLNESGALAKFRSCGVAEAFGGGCGVGTAKLTEKQLDELKSAGTIESFVRTAGNELFLVAGGTKREVSNLEALKAIGMFTAVTNNIPAELVDGLPYGSPIITRGGVIAGAGGEQPILIDGDRIGHPVPDEFATMGGLATTSTFTSESYAAIEQGEPISALMTDGSANYLVTDKGLLKVSSAQYGSGVRFNTVSAATIAALPGAGTALGAHFVQMKGDDQIQLIAGGERFPLADAAAVESEAEKRGIDATVYTTVAGAVTGIVEGNGIVNGSVLKPQNSEELFILDGMYLQPVASIEIAQALGFTQAPITITTESFENIEQRETTLDGTQLTCHGVTGFAAGGVLRPYPNSEVEADYGLASQALSETLCGLIPVGEPMSDILRDGKHVYWVVGGEKRPIGWPELVNAFGDGYSRAVIVSEQVADQLPTGNTVTAVPTGYEPPTGTPQPTEPIETPEPTVTPEPTDPSTVEPTETSVPTAVPEPTETTTPEPTETEEPPVALEIGDVITDAAGTGIWLVNGEQLVQIGSPSVAAHLDIAIDGAITVPQSNFEQFGSNIAPLYSSAVRCEGTNSIGIDGKLVPFESADTEAAFGLDYVELAPEVCGTLTHSTLSLGTEVTLPNGNVYVVENGELRLKTAASFSPAPTESAPADGEPTETPEATDGAANEEGPGSTGETPDATDAASTDEPEADEPGATDAPETTEPAATEQPALLVLPIEVVSAMKRGAPIEA